MNDSGFDSSPQSYRLTFKHESLGSLTFDIDGQNTLFDVYRRIRNHYNIESFYLMVNDVRLPDNNTKVSASQLASPNCPVVSIVIQGIDTAIRTAYICEKCGSTVFRTPDDDIMCRAEGCFHTILLKTRSKQRTEYLAR